MDHSSSQMALHDDVSTNMTSALFRMLLTSNGIPVGIEMYHLGLYSKFPNKHFPPLVVVRAL